MNQMFKLSQSTILIKTVCLRLKTEESFFGIFLDENVSFSSLQDWIVFHFMMLKCFQLVRGLDLRPAGPAPRLFYHDVFSENFRFQCIWFPRQVSTFPRRSFWIMSTRDFFFFLHQSFAHISYSEFFFHFASLKFKMRSFSSNGKCDI